LQALPSRPSHNKVFQATPAKLFRLRHYLAVEYLSIVLPLSVHQRSHELIVYLDHEFMAFEMKPNTYVDLKGDLVSLQT
jgi:hypothetical protein